MGGEEEEKSLTTALSRLDNNSNNNKRTVSHRERAMGRKVGGHMCRNFPLTGHEGIPSRTRSRCSWNGFQLVPTQTGPLHHPLETIQGEGRFGTDAVTFVTLGLFIPEKYWTLGPSL